jgi:hypothetical protein
MDEQNEPLVVVKPKRGRQILSVVVILVLAVACGVLGYMYYQQRLALDVKQKENDNLKNQLGTSRAEAAISDDIAKRLQAQLDEAQSSTDEFATTTLLYALDPGSILIEDRGQEGSTLSIQTFDRANSYTSTTEVGGYFDHSNTPDFQKDQPESFQRISNGLWRFDIAVDFSEAGYFTKWFINPKLKRALSVGDGTVNAAFEGSGYHIIFADGTTGDLMIHTSSYTCDVDQKQVVDTLTWNDKTVFQFARPLNTRCDFSELGGGYSYFFKGMPIPALDLESVSLPMTNGSVLSVVAKNGDVSVSLK